MKITWSLFPKYFKDLSVEELADLVRTVGLDTTNLVIRQAYWAETESLAKDVPAFVKTMGARGLKIHFATTDFSAEFLAGNPQILEILADNGIAEFRLGHFKLSDEGNSSATVHDLMVQARQDIERLLPICERTGLRAIYQVHPYRLIQSATAAWNLVRGLPAQQIGVMLDPGNMILQGLEDWGYATDLLAGYLVALGVKDLAFSRDADSADTPEKGWGWRWASVRQGQVNWLEVLSALENSNFAGTFVFMPFYWENDPQAMTGQAMMKTLEEEVEYLRGIVEAMLANAGLGPKPKLP